jgi:hypothetical protein
MITKNDNPFVLKKIKEIASNLETLQGINGGSEPILSGYSTVTAVASVIDLLTPHADANYILINPEGDIRIKVDGTNPTSSEGFLFKSGDYITVTAQEASAMKVIRAGSDDVIINIQQYK